MNPQPCSSAIMTRLILIAIWSGLGLAGSGSPAAASPWLGDDPVQALPAFGQGEGMPAMDELFRNKDGWIGADGAHSFPISDTKTIWLFSDSWIGKVRDGKRKDATLVNNTVAVQAGHGKNSKVRFVVRKKSDGKPASFVTPADGKGYYWLQAGALVEKRALLFLSQIESTGAGGSFGFKQVAQWIGIVDNPQADPLSWHIEQHKLDNVLMTPKRMLTWGAAVLIDGEFLYLYGTDEDKKKGGPDRYLIVARVPLEQARDVGAWRYYAKGEWKQDFREAERVSNEMASEGSVTFIPALKHYALVYTKAGLSDKICVRTAPNPWGPWSQPASVYTCPDMSWDRRIFCYAAKAHGEQTRANELIITYAANSFDFWHVAADARLYWPRFVRVPITGEE
jgi:hypothetical protein